VQNKITAINTYQQLDEYREDMAAGFFETVIKQCEQIIEKNETAPPADVAFYALGEVYAYYNFAGKDYALSQYYFEKLVDNFPDSTLASEAKTYLSLFETIAAKEQESAVMEEKVLTAIEENSAEIKKQSLAATEPSKLLENQNFEEAEKKNLRIVEEAGREKPADAALYNLGLIYAHADNPAKDYQKSQLYFKKLTEQFPDSQFAEEAQIWLGVFATIEKMQQIDVDIEQQKKQLNR
jgi:tetratricopeptide (TPR) repeat protein